MSIFYRFARLLLFLFIKPLFRIQAYHFSEISMNGPVVLASNHASNWDPVFLAVAYPRQIHFFAKKELFEIPLLRKIVSSLGAVPVDRGANDIKAVKAALSVLKAQKVLGIFPEGTRVEEYDKNNVKSGVAVIGIRGNAEFIPVYIESTYKLFRKTKIFFGESLRYPADHKLSAEEYRAYSEDLLKKIYDLKTKVNK